MNFVVMIKLTKGAVAQPSAIQEEKIEGKLDHTLRSKESPEYRLEASIDILKLYETLNGLEMTGTTPSLFGGHNIISLGLYAGNANGHSPTIIFPEELQHPSATLTMPNTDGGSVSSHLSSLSNTNIQTSFVTVEEGAKCDFTQI